MTALEVTPTNVNACKARPIAGTHLPAFVFATGRDLARHAAQMIARLIRERSELGQKNRAGSATGSTPVGTYRELIRLHQTEGLDLSSVVAFYGRIHYGLPADSPQSHRLWLQEHFFGMSIFQAKASLLRWYDRCVGRRFALPTLRRGDPKRRRVRPGLARHWSQWPHRFQ